jgi:hypothetical protein
MHIPLRRVDCAIGVPFQQVQHRNERRDLQYGPDIGNGIDALFEDMGDNVDRHRGAMGRKKFRRRGTWSLAKRIAARGVIACDCASAFDAWSKPSYESQY